MVKAFKKITFTLLISSALALSSLAQTDDHWQAKPKQDRPKQPEQIPEKEKRKGGDDRGGKDGKKPKDKKPDGENY